MRKQTVTSITITQDDIIAMIKERLAFYRRGLVSLDDLFGYLYALEDIGLVTADQFTAIVACVCKVN